MDDGDDLLIRRTSTADQVAQAIRGRILRGDLPPGTALREVALANSMGVSRNTVREGIRALVGEGLVRHSIHRGVFVARLTIEDIRDIFHLRAVVEVAAARQRSFPRAVLERMDATVAELGRAIEVEDSEAIVEADLRFHGEMVESLASPRLCAAHRSALSELRLGLFMLDSDDEREQPTDWLKHHRRILELLTAGRGAECGKVVQEHLDYTVHRLVERLAAATPSDQP